MHTTSPTLLAQLRKPDQGEAWRRFVHLYTPLLFSWAGRARMPEADAADLVQDVFALLVKKMPEFSYQPGGKLRAWLRTVTLNKLRDWRRKNSVKGTIPLEALPELAADDPAEQFWETEYQRQLLRGAMDLIRPEFEPRTWAACSEFVFGGRSAAAVAVEHGISENAVYIAKCRVVRRIREELAGLLD